MVAQIVSNLHDKMSLMWGSSKDFDKESMILIDAAFLAKWPKLRHEKQQRAINEQLSFLSLPTVRPSFTMITWNINSLRKRYSLMQTIITEHLPDILFLQETKLTDEDFDKLVMGRRAFTFENFTAVGLHSDEFIKIIK